MSKNKDKDYDTTVARISGNLLSGIMANGEAIKGGQVMNAVAIARMIVKEVKATE